MIDDDDDDDSNSDSNDNNNNTLDVFFTIHSPYCTVPQPSRQVCEAVV